MKWLPWLVCAGCLAPVKTPAEVEVQQRVDLRSPRAMLPLSDTLVAVLADRLTVLDISDPFEPTSVALTTEISAACVHDGSLWFAQPNGSTSAVFELPLDGPLTDKSVLHAFDTPLGVHSMTVVDGELVVASPDEIRAIGWDGTPSWTGLKPDELQRIHAITSDGEQLFVTAANAGVLMMNSVGPDAAATSRLSRRVQTPVFGAGVVWIPGTTVLGYDVSTPDRPNLRAQTGLCNGAADADDDYLICGTAVYDITDPWAPTAIATFPVGQRSSSVTKVGDVVLRGSSDGVELMGGVAW